MTRRLCLYHDQALIPIKTLHFDDGVNLTLGPADRPHLARPWHRVRHRRHRTSADPGAMIAAIRMAASCRARERYAPAK
jgi:4-hydroxythreonine-4-phosphate dehydrogenase